VSETPIAPFTVRPAPRAQGAEHPDGYAVWPLRGPRAQRGGPAPPRSGPLAPQAKILKIKALRNEAPSAKIEDRVLRPLCLGKKHSPVLIN
jgi:hypothetical protein